MGRLKKTNKGHTTYDLNIAPKKAHLRVRAIKVLGNRVTAERLPPDPGRVEALIKMPMPAMFDSCDRC